MYAAKESKQLWEVAQSRFRGCAPAEMAFGDILFISFARYAESLGSNIECYLCTNGKSYV